LRVAATTLTFGLGPGLASRGAAVTLSRQTSGGR
jgi:hypothetical protein